MNKVGAVVAGAKQVFMQGEGAFKDRMFRLKEFLRRKNSYIKTTGDCTAEIYVFGELALKVSCGAQGPSVMNVGSGGYGSTLMTGKEDPGSMTIVNGEGWGVWGWG